MVGSHTLLPLRRSVVSRIFINISKPYQAVCFGLFKHRLTPELLLNSEFLYIFYYSLSIRSLLNLFPSCRRVENFQGAGESKVERCGIKLIWNISYFSRSRWSVWNVSTVNAPLFSALETPQHEINLTNWEEIFHVSHWLTAMLKCRCWCVDELVIFLSRAQRLSCEFWQKSKKVGEKEKHTAVELQRGKNSSRIIKQKPLTLD